MKKSATIGNANICIYTEKIYFQKNISLYKCQVIVIAKKMGISHAC